MGATESSVLPLERRVLYSFQQSQKRKFDRCDSRSKLVLLPGVNGPTVLEAAHSRHENLGTTKVVDTAFCFIPRESPYAAIGEGIQFVLSPFHGTI